MPITMRDVRTGIEIDGDDCVNGTLDAGNRWLAAMFSMQRNRWLAPFRSGTSLPDVRGWGER